MKKGDKLYCIKRKNNWKIQLGDICIVDHIYFSNVVLRNPSSDGVTHFSLESHEHKFSERYLWEYFCTKKGLRKLKLEEINESR